MRHRKFRRFYNLFRGTGICRLSLKGGTGNRGIGERGILGNIGESLKGGTSGNL